MLFGLRVIKSHWYDPKVIWKVLITKVRSADQHHSGPEARIWKLLEYCFDLIHKKSNLIGTNFIQNQVIGTQENKLNPFFFQDPQRLELIYPI